MYPLRLLTLTFVGANNDENHGHKNNNATIERRSRPFGILDRAEKKV